MRALTIDEMKFVAGGYAEGQEVQDEPTELPDVIVTAKRQAQRTVGFLADLFGFDSGSFSIHDMGISGGVGYVTAQVGGLGVAVPLDEDGTPMVGVDVSVDIDPTDGSIMPHAPTGVSYDPNLNPGLNLGFGASYWVEIPTPYGGIGNYPVPGGEPGETYWGFEPGSPLSPFPGH